MEPLLQQVLGLDEDLDKLGSELFFRIDHWSSSDALVRDIRSGNRAVRTDTEKLLMFDSASYYGRYEAEFGIMNMFRGTINFLCDAYDAAAAEVGMIETRTRGRSTFTI